MFDPTFATARAYDYGWSNCEYDLKFRMHEIAGEPGSYRFTACAYRGGQIFSFYHDKVTDVYGVHDSLDALDQLFIAADDCIREAFACFDVVYCLTDANGSIWHPSQHVGRAMLAEMFRREGVDCYPLTAADVQRYAIEWNGPVSHDYYYTVTVQDLSRDGKTDVQRFRDEQAARTYAASMAGALDDSGTLFDIDVHYVDIEHKTWITGYSNVAA